MAAEKNCDCLGDLWIERPFLEHEPVTDFNLRPYQAEAVAGVFKSWEQFDRVLGIAPTGSGKTVIFADIAQKRLAFGRVLVLAHRDELIDQTIDKLYRARQLRAAKEKATDRADLDAGVVVASVQTLSRRKRLERFTRGHFVTTKQLSYLRYLSYRADVSNLSKPAAARLIGQIKGKEIAPNGQ